MKPPSLSPILVLDVTVWGFGTAEVASTIRYSGGATQEREAIEWR
jgi:hypothetical protein